MRLRICAVVCGLCFLGAVPGVAGATVIFGAAVFGPVSGAPFEAAGLASLAPVAHAWAVTLTRTVDTRSALLAAAAADHRHFRTLRLAWSVAGGIETECLDDVGVSGYAKRAPAAGAPALERLTLTYAALTRTLGTAACRHRAPPPPVFARLFTDAGGRLHAQLDCLLARCTGGARLYCPSFGCPSAGIGLGVLKLGAGESTAAAVPAVHGVRGRHPKLTVVIRLTGRRPAIVARVVVDAPPPPAFAALTAAVPTTSGNPTPVGSDGATVGGPPAAGGGGAPAAGSGGGGGGASGTAPGTGAGSGSGTGSGSGSGSGSGPGSGGGSGSGEPVDTTLTLSCDGASGGTFRAVHGALGPNLAGQSIEIDYVPVDPNADTVIDYATTGAGGRFTDVPSAPFVEAIAFYGGDDTYNSSSGFCPASSS